MVRTPNESDGRGVHVDLTDEGRKLIDQALPDHVNAEQRLLAGLTPDQRESLADILRRLLVSLGDEV